MGLMTLRHSTPVSGSWRTGEAKLYTMRSTGPRSFSTLTTSAFRASENASPSSVWVQSPAASAARSKARLQ